MDAPHCTLCNSAHWSRQPCAGGGVRVTRTPPGVSVTSKRVSVTSPGVSVTSPQGSRVELAAALAEVELLRAEVRRLKRELAARSAPVAVASTGEVHPDAPRPHAKRLARASLGGRPAKPGALTSAERVRALRDRRKAKP